MRATPDSVSMKAAACRGVSKVFSIMTSASANPASRSPRSTWTAFTTLPPSPMGKAYPAMAASGSRRMGRGS